jgi:hypothetical protein
MLQEEAASLEVFTSVNPDIVGSVYHLVRYMQSNKIHNVVLMSKF